MKPAPKPVNEIYTLVHTFLRDLMEIHNDNKQLKSCFTNNYLRDYDENAIASYAFNLPVASFQQENKVFKDKILKTSDLFSSVQNKNPIFLYAFVGQGKTTYLKHLINIEWQENPDFSELNKKTYFIYLAYTNDDPNCKNIESDFYDETIKIVHHILEVHEIDISNDYDVLAEIFEAEKIQYELTNKNKNTSVFIDFILKKKEHLGFFRRICIWLFEVKKIKICCIVDNIDQHFKFFKETNFEVFTDLFQTVFSFNIQPIIPLRISNKGFQTLNFFDSYHSIPINLGLPDFGDLIGKRLKYIKNYFEEKLGKPIWISEEKDYITTDDVFSTFFSIANLIRANDEVKDSVYKLSNNITREYIRIMVNMFSGRALFYHPLTNEKIDYSHRVKMGKFHSLFIYSLMLRENTVHDETDDDVPIVNLFNNLSNNNWNRMLRYHLLVYLNNKVTSRIHINLLIEKFQIIYPGINEESILSALKVFGKKKCIGVASESQIEKLDVVEMIDSRDCYINIALRGRFHLELAKELEYYEVLAIQQFNRTKKQRKHIYEAKKEERAENLKNFIDSLQFDEDHLKAIYCDENTYKHQLLWTNEILPILTAEYAKVFDKQQGTTKHKQNAAN